MKMQLDHVQLAVPEGSEDICRAFWCDCVGLHEIEKPKALHPRGGLWLALDDAQLHLGVERPFLPAQKAHPGLQTGDIDALASRLTDTGHNVTWDNTIPNRRRFFVLDPFGNRLEFLEDQK